MWKLEVVISLRTSNCNIAELDNRMKIVLPKHKTYFIPYRCWILFRKTKRACAQHFLSFLDTEMKQWYPIVMSSNWNIFRRHWPFVRKIHRSPVDSPHKGQWRGASVFSLICARTNGWANIGDAGDLRRHHTHYDVTVMLAAWGTNFFLNISVSTPEGWPHWARDKIVIIWQTTFSNAFSWIKKYEFRLRFHWSLLLRIEITIFQHRSR